MHASSLNNPPQSYYTGVVERLSVVSRSLALIDHRQVIYEAATAISELQSERDALKHDIERHLGIIAELESSLSRIKSETVEACAKIAAGHNGISPRDSRDIASAIRSLSTDDSKGSERNSTRNEGSR